MQTEKKLTQKERIIRRLKQGPVTNIELNDICFRYSARIHELKKEGYEITIKGIKGAMFEYRLGNE